jgi:predicted metalloprotease with PDZ domain
MNKVVLFFLFMLILGACAPVNSPPIIEPTETRNIVIPTAPFTSTKTITVAPKPTLTITPTLTATSDYSNLGNPSIKTAYKYPSWLPINYFKFDSQDYNVYTKTIHGTDVIVAIHKDLDMVSETPPRNAFVDFVFNTFALHWEVFDGYPYEEYIVKVVSPTSNQTFITATAIGFVIETKPGNPIDWFTTCRIPCASNYKQFVTHEMFHAWNGEIITDIGSHVNYVRPEMWFVQGATQYYGYRGTPQELGLYDIRINDSWDRYTNWIGTKFDIPITDMSKYYETTREWEYYQNISDKGACLFYLIDKELIGQGKSLDDLMKYMYENHGLQGKRFTTNDIFVALNTITASDWTGFFNKYVFGIEPLPLNGIFEYLNH